MNAADMRMVWVLAALLAALVPGWVRGSVAAEAGPGERFRVTLPDLPAPGPAPFVANPAREVRRPPGVPVKVPAGFRVELFAEGLSHARNLLAAPGGGMFLAESKPGRITLLKDGDGDGRAEIKAPFAEGFRMPHGMALHRNALLVADLEGVWRLPISADGLRAEGRERLTPPGALGDPGGHFTRNLALHPQGERFYVAIGSRANLAEEEAPRATIREFRVDGSGGRTFASGLRNPVGLAFRPGTAELWTTVNERDGMGDRLVPDYLTRVAEGGFYGWPYAYLGPNPQPGFAERAPEMVGRTLVPDLFFQAHSAPLGLAFWRGDAFVALHGSWNRAEPVGYFLARVPFEGGRPAGHYEAFATGFALSWDGRASVWGRPAGVAVGDDGALYLADDVGQTVWRIAPVADSRPSSRPRLRPRATWRVSQGRRKPPARRLRAPLK